MSRRTRRKPTDKDYAIEFGEYLAIAAVNFQMTIVANDERVENGEEPNLVTLNDAWRALESAVYEFRKRAVKALPTIMWQLNSTSGEAPVRRRA
jgi:hypothetical protein